jgi:hypothetical protein
MRTEFKYPLHGYAPSVNAPIDIEFAESPMVVAVESELTEVPFTYNVIVLPLLTTAT